MLAKILSGANLGIESFPVIVEVDIASSGLPAFNIVGLADRAIEEARERVRSALKNSGFDYPAKRITVNLAPADIKKEGPLFDLAIALGILIGSGQLEAETEESLFAGELSLDGSLRYTQGILPLVLLAKKEGIKRVFIPRDNALEASIVEGVEVFSVDNLKDLSLFFKNEIEIVPEKLLKIEIDENQNYEFDFEQIKGQEQAKRALEIAAAGGHNVLMKGPPGAGKTLLSRSFPSILPKLSLEEIIELTKIFSIAGRLSKDMPYITKSPFRSPHHTASYVGILGGGNSIKPGEVSLANNGVLFLDEVAEFSRYVLEALRQPLEDKRIVISRSSGTVEFPTKFILLAALNPCPCGNYGSLIKECTCLTSQITRYQKKVSGPLLDRIDIHLEIPAVRVDELNSGIEAENSMNIRKRVEKARVVQNGRLKESGVMLNSEMNNKQVKQFCNLTDSATAFLKIANQKMNLSARSYFRVLKVSRTIADLDRQDLIDEKHVAEALQYRFKS